MALQTWAAGWRVGPCVERQGQLDDLPRVTHLLSGGGEGLETEGRNLWVWRQSEKQAVLNESLFNQRGSGKQSQNLRMESKQHTQEQAITYAIMSCQVE